MSAVSSSWAVNLTEQDISHFFLVNIALTGTSYVEVGYFTAVEGLSRRFQTLPYAEGGRAIPLMLMVPAPFGELTLRWGQMSSSALWDWAAAVQVGNGFRRNVQIVHYIRDGASPVRTFTVTGAWPIEWRGATLDAGSSQVAVEQLSLQYDQLTLTVGTSAPAVTL